MENLPRFSRGFAAGAVGGIANVITVALFSALGIIALMGIDLPPLDLKAFLYKQIVWGGLWGIFLATPVLASSWWQRGILLGLMASAVALFYFFPATPAGILGLNAGALTWLLVVIVNTVYGVAASWWYENAT